MTYRFGFVMSTALGNLTRYLNFRKFADRDVEVEPVWAPVTHAIPPGEPNPFARWPEAVRTRAIAIRQAWPVLGSLDVLDAVLVHHFESELYLGVRSLVTRRPPYLVSSDQAPALDPSSHPMHERDRAKATWRKRLRLEVDVWCAKRAAMHVPFSHWAADALARAGVAESRIAPIHTGIDLEGWPRISRRPRAADRKPRFLFVGGEFARKGGPGLLRVFADRFGGRAELDVVSDTAPTIVPADVRVHRGLRPNTLALKNLFGEADALVHPTTADFSGWVVLEAAACGCPAIVTGTGGVPELVSEGQTGFVVPVGNDSRLGDAMERFLVDPLRNFEMGIAARRRVEQEFSAEVNVRRMLALMKHQVQARRNSKVVQ